MSESFLKIEECQSVGGDLGKQSFPFGALKSVFKLKLGPRLIGYLMPELMMPIQVVAIGRAAYFWPILRCKSF